MANVHAQVAITTPPAAAGAPAGGGYLPVYKFKVGDVYNYNMTADSTINVNLGSGAPEGAQQTMPTTATFHVDALNTWKVVAISDSTGLAQLQNSVVIQDATVDGTDNTAAARAAMANRPVTYIDMNELGESVSAGAAPDPAAEKALHKVGLDSHDFWLSRFGVSQLPVNVGDTWDGVPAANVPTLAIRSILASASPSSTGTILRLVTRCSGSSSDAPQQKDQYKLTADVLFNIDQGQIQSATTYTDEVETRPLPGSTNGAPMSFHTVTKVAMTRAPGG